MKKVGKFYVVSYEQFRKDLINITYDGENLNEAYIKDAYLNYVKVPVRSTAGSAGYDFVSPFSLTILPGGDITIATGIHVHITKKGWFLCLVPRSGLGFKYYTRLANTIGIVDEDYYYSSNEGHILIKIRNEGDEPLPIKAGDRIAQGIFMKYGITEDDYVTDTRDGGFGSTGK